MSPRVRILLAVALLVVLGVIAGAIGSRANREPSFDPRRSVQLTGPYGAKAYAEALDRLDVSVELYRQRIAQLASHQASEGQVFALLDPAELLDGAQAEELVAFHESQGDLLLAGWTTSLVMQCFGYDVDYRSDDSTPVYRLEAGPASAEAVSWTSDMVLARILDTVVTDTSDLKAGIANQCAIPEPAEVDTILVTAGGRPAALRLAYPEAGSVTLVADGILFSNGRLRESQAGLVVLPMVAGRYRRAVFDEYEHGFGPGGSLLSATLDWSFNTPYGWVFWQLAIVGFIALLAGAIRFGAARRVIERRRRSPLEHVRALAIALSAARGSHVAVDLMVRGLRRRLSPAGPPVRGDLQGWLAGLADNVRTSRSKQAVSTLINLTRRAPGTDSVLRAADAVEEVWQDLKPPSPSR